MIYTSSNSPNLRSKATMYFLLTFCLPLFSAFTTIIALPLAQSDFSLFSSDSPGSSITSSQASGDFELATFLYPKNNNNINEQPATALLVAGKKGNCQSSSVDIQVIGKRQTDSACPAQLNGSPGQGIPDSKSTSPRLEAVPNPEPLLPPLTLENPDEDKCPVELMGMSRIPVCDSGRSWQDMMRMPGVKYYTLFNIHLSMFECIFRIDREF